jgi:hypothetical protein
MRVEWTWAGPDGLEFPQYILSQGGFAPTELVGTVVKIVDGSAGCDLPEGAVASSQFRAFIGWVSRSEPNQGRSDGIKVMTDNMFGQDGLPTDSSEDAFYTVNVRCDETGPPLPWPPTLQQAQEWPPGEPGEERFMTAADFDEEDAQGEGEGERIGEGEGERIGEGEDE